jgi:release factor glutamine methyltransferase
VTTLGEEASTRTVDFGPLAITFDGAVLEPRPWTMLQAGWAAELLGRWDREQRTLLELCCGAGQIGLAASALLGGVRLVLVDASPDAVAWSRYNAAVSGFGSQTQVVAGDLRTLELGTQFDVVIADPPYLAADDERDPRDPVSAVDGGPDGLALARPAVAAAARHVRPHGDVLLQARGEAQVAKIEPHASACGLVLVECRSVDDERAVARFRKEERR